MSNYIFNGANKSLTISISNYTYSSFNIYYNVQLTGQTSIDYTQVIDLGYYLNNADDTIINIDTNIDGIYILYRYITDEPRCNSSDCNGFLYHSISGVKDNGTYNSTNNIFYLPTAYSANGSIIETKIACQNLLSFSDLTNCTLDKNEITFIDCQSNYFDLTMIANNGYFFTILPTLDYENMGMVRSYTGEANADLTECTFHVAVAINYNGNFSYIIGTCEEPTEISDKFGLITLYKPTNEILKALPTKMIHTHDFGNDTYQLQDLSTYIVSFLSMPLDVPVFSSKTMTLNSISTDIIVDYINDNVFVLDFGTVHITGFYNNSNDYKNTSISIYLPFIGVVSLDVNKYMDKIIHLQYKIDLFTGNFLAILQDDAFNILDTYTGNLSIKVPYIMGQGADKNINSYSDNTLSLLSDKIPKITVITNNINYNIPIETNKETILNVLTGFNVIDNIIISDNSISKKEIDLIIDELKNGVIF